MKMLIGLAFIFISQFASAQIERCQDIGCYQVQEAIWGERQRQEDRQNLKRFHDTQIQLEAARVEELQRQNDLLEEQVQVLDEQRMIVAQQLEIDKQTNQRNINELKAKEEAKKRLTPRNQNAPN